MTQSSETASALAPSAVTQLAQMPLDELRHLAEEFGLDATRYDTRVHLAAAIQERRQTIAALDREAMLDIVRWGRRPVSANATREQLAREIARIQSMRFSGLSPAGLAALARLRGCRVRGDEAVPDLVRELKRAEGLFARLGRKRRALTASLVAKVVGDDRASEDYRFVPPAPQDPRAATPGKPPASVPPPRGASLREDIEEVGLISGLANRVRRSADDYLNQKLDEIELRIDRKLEEIDKRLAEWRDKEVANRLRIIKITLWASLIVALVSLVYSWIKVHVAS